MPDLASSLLFAPTPLRPNNILQPSVEALQRRADPPKVGTIITERVVSDDDDDEIDDPWAERMPTRYASSTPARLMPPAPRVKFIDLPAAEGRSTPTPMRSPSPRRNWNAVHIEIPSNFLTHPQVVTPKMRSAQIQDTLERLSRGLMAVSIWPMTSRAAGSFSGSVPEFIEFGLQLDVARVYFDCTLRSRKNAAGANALDIRDELRARNGFGDSGEVWGRLHRRLGAKLGALRTQTGRICVQQLQTLIAAAEEPDARTPAVAPALKAPPALFASQFTSLGLPFQQAVDVVRQGTPAKAAQVLFEWATNCQDWPMAKRALASYLRLTKTSVSPYDAHPLATSPALMHWADASPPECLIAVPAWQEQKFFLFEEHKVLFAARRWPGEALVPRLLLQLALPDTIGNPQHQRLASRLLTDAANNGATVGPQLFALFEDGWIQAGWPSGNGPLSPPNLTHFALKALTAPPAPTISGPMCLDTEVASVIVLSKKPLAVWLQIHAVDLDELRGGPSAMSELTVARAVALVAQATMTASEQVIRHFIRDYPKACTVPSLHHAVVAASWRTGQCSEAIDLLAAGCSGVLSDPLRPLLREMLTWAVAQCKPWPCQERDEDEMYDEQALHSRAVPLMRLLSALYCRRDEGLFYSHMASVPSSLLAVWQRSGPQPPQPLSPGAGFELEGARGLARDVAQPA